ncbi:MAG: hypothetical protein Q8K72_16815 [Acidimicrobiales bacterium]|nr:hypothetical protein [Acidimicrobiales bacterium]
MSTADDPTRTALSVQFTYSLPPSRRSRHAPVLERHTHGARAPS